LYKSIRQQVNDLLLCEEIDVTIEIFCEIMEKYLSNKKETKIPLYLFEKTFGFDSDLIKHHWIGKKLRNNLKKRNIRVTKVKNKNLVRVRLNN